MPARSSAAAPEVLDDGEMGAVETLAVDLDVLQHPLGCDRRDTQIAELGYFSLKMT